MKKIVHLILISAILANVYAADIIVTTADEFKQAVSIDVQNGDIIKFNLPSGTNNTLDLAQATKLQIRCAENTAVTIDGALPGGERTILTNSITTQEEFFNYAGSANFDGASVTFKNLIIRDFKMNGRSGLIRSGNSAWTTAGKTNQIVFENVTFINNQQATPAVADGLFDLRQGTIATFHNCSFVENKILQNEVPTGGKKTLFALNSNISGFHLINCTFYGNEVGTAAATQYLIENAGVNTKIVNCTFVNNTAPKGIMRVVKSKDYSYVVNSLFAYNTASGTDQTAVDLIAANVSTDGLNTVSAQTIVAYCAFNSGSYITPDAPGIHTGSAYDQASLFSGFTSGKPNLNRVNYTVPLAKNITGIATFTGVDIPSVDQLGSVRNVVNPTLGALEFLTTGISPLTSGNFKLVVGKQGLVVLDADDQDFVLYDSMGRKLKSGKLINNVIELQSIRPGVYFLTMNNKSEKFVVY